MILTRRFLFLLFCLSALVAASAADKPRPDGSPEIVRTAAGLTEVGTLAQVPYRIDIPAAWNHALVVYYHGYSQGPYLYRARGPLNEQTQPIFDRGYAIIQSGYSVSGWALAQAYPETEQLRLYFLDHYGKPAEGKEARTMETIVEGASMGGALAVATLELNPRPYEAGLDLCGSVGPADLAFQRRFAWRAAFDFYFPNVLPPLVPGPIDFRDTPAAEKRVFDALHANPPAAAAIRNLTGLHSDHDVAEDMAYFTYVLADMQHKAGGNPFDNQNYLYTGATPGATPADNALNDGVHRYAADPRARDYLMHHYTPTGRLNHPMLALHTTYDPRIPGSTLAVYAEQVAIAGFSGNLVQQYVHRDGHCTFTEEEVGRTFDELMDWVHTGRRPAAGLLPPAPRLSPPGTQTSERR